MAAKKKTSSARPASKASAKKSVAKPPAKASAKGTAPKSGKAAPPVKDRKPAIALAAKPARATRAKASTAGTPAKASKATLATKVKAAAQKVAQVAAQAALKVLDADAGRKAPGFELSNEKGEVVSSASLAGKPYVLYFYPKDDTPGCTKEACDIRDNFGRFGKQGLRVLGVSPDSQQSHAKFAKKYGLPFTLLADPDKTLATAYGVWGPKKNYGKEYMGIIRSTFLIGADGQIKKAYRGVRVDGHAAAILSDAQSLL